MTVSRSLPLTYRATDSTPIYLIASDDYTSWRGSRPAPEQRWLDRCAPEPSAGEWSLLPGEGGEVAGVVGITERADDLSLLAALAAQLPRGTYRLADPADETEAAWHWCGGSYQFTRYREASASERILALSGLSGGAEEAIRARLWVRDLINTSAADLGPAELADAAAELASECGAELSLVRGDELAAQYPMVAAVGRGAARPPVLIDLTWGDESAPGLTLVGKGVIFDSGGLDIKPANFMRNMKKDMGGAAHALALARIVMKEQLPVRLRLLVPAVENAVGGDSFRPGDVLRSRKGLTVEIHNTDAEGRLVLADALAAATSENPDLLVDFATLTGAARVALGADIPAFFCEDDELAAAIVDACRSVGEPLWRMPLHRDYRSLLESTCADLTNAGSTRHAGAITAALFLAEFAVDAERWAHIDLYAWNDSAKPGRPAGGTDQCLRGLWRFLGERYGERP